MFRTVNDLRYYYTKNLLIEKGGRGAGKFRVVERRSRSEVEADTVERGAHLGVFVSQEQPGFSENKTWRFMPNIQRLAVMPNLYHT